MYAEEQYDSLKLRLGIDQMDLDGELMRLAPDTQTVSEACADAIQIRDTCKAQLDRTIAQAASVMRNGDSKISEKRIESEVYLVDAVQEAIIALDEAKHDLAYWQALVQSYSEKGSSLRRICEMMLAGYLTPSSVYAERKSEMQANRSELREADNRPRLHRR